MTCSFQQTKQWLEKGLKKVFVEITNLLIYGDSKVCDNFCSTQRATIFIREEIESIIKFEHASEDSIREAKAKYIKNYIRKNVVNHIAMTESQIKENLDRVGLTSYHVEKYTKEVYKLKIIHDMLKKGQPVYIKM